MVIYIRHGTQYSNKILEMFKNWLVVLVALSVQGIKLPGTCPKDPPPSLDLSCEKYSVLDIIAGVSYSPEQSSHLFGNFNNNSNGWFSMSLWSLNESLSFTSMTYHNEQLIDIVYNEISKENGVRILQSTVLATNSKCYPSINEIVHVWCEDDIIILWSCENITKKEHRQHDEAVLIVVKSQYRSFDEKYALFYRIQNMSTKYLNTALMEKIQWSDPNNTDTHNTLAIPYTCSSFETVTLKDLSKIVGGPVIFMICVVVVFYRENIICKMCKRDRRIHPTTG